MGHASLDSLLRVKIWHQGPEIVWAYIKRKKIDWSGHLLADGKTRTEMFYGQRIVLLNHQNYKIITKEIETTNEWNIANA